MRLTLCITAIVISACPFFYSQSIGFSIGYGALNMDGVNGLMSQISTFYSDYGIYAKPENVKSGLFLEGNAKYGIGDANVGIMYDYISSSGSYGWSITGGSYNTNFDVSTGELLGMLEFLLGGDSSVVQPFLKAAGGIGFASAHFKYEFKNYDDPSYNIDLDHPLSGTYFAGRVEAGLQFVFKSAVLEFGLGYRMADARDLKGDQTVNGYSFSNIPLRDMHDQAVKFDYSGFLFRGGIDLRLW